jgi:hypothetical protein
MLRKIIVFALAAGLSAGVANVASARGGGGGGGHGGGGGFGGGGFGGVGGGFGGVHVGGVGGGFSGHVNGVGLGGSGLGNGLGGHLGGSGLGGYPVGGFGSAPMATDPGHFAGASALVGEHVAHPIGARPHIHTRQHYRPYIGGYDLCNTEPYYYRTPYPYYPCNP